MDRTSIGTMPPRRVLYVVSLFPSWSETFIVREIRALAEGGVDVRVLSLKRPAGGLVQADAAALLDRSRHPQGLPTALRASLRAAVSRPRAVLGATAAILADTWRSPSAMAKSLAALVRGLEHLDWLREFDPEYIHAHWSTYPSTAAWALARTLSRPFGFTCHAHDVFVNRQLMARKLADAALAVTISRHNVEWLGRNVSPLARRLEVVHCGVDLDRIEWRPDGRSGDLILAVGRFVPIKGFDTLIDALALVRQRGRRFRCRLIGDGPLRAGLEARVRKLGLGHCVEMPGALPQESVRAALDEAAVFALPCQVAPDGSRDGIPVALMEAMAAGCAVISCPVSGVPELIADGEHGLLVPERDPSALAQGLVRLLDDAGLRRRMATAARHRIERDFDARKEARRLHDLMMRSVTHVA